MPAGVGGVATTQDDINKRTVSVFDKFTAAEKADALTGSPATDTTSKIQAAIDGALILGQRLVGYGTFRIGAAKLVFKGDTDFSQATFLVYGAPAVAVEVSTGSAANPVDNVLHKRVYLGSILNMTKPATGWLGQGIGVRLVGLLHCDTKIKHIQGFAIGKLETAFSSGHSYNDAEVLYFENNQINHKLQPGDATAWVNENMSHGGRYHYRDAEGSEVAGTRQIQILPFDVTNSTASWPNNNIFDKPSLEGNVPQYHAEISGNDNVIRRGRWETFAAVLPKVLFTGHSSNVSKTSRNVIEGGYQADLIVFSATGVGLMGELVHARRHARSGFGINSALRNTGGDIATTPIRRIYSSAKDVLNAAIADTDWTVNEYANGVEYKKTTDAFPRMWVDAQTGRIYYGDGTAAPTKYFGLNTSNPAFLSVNTSVVPTANDTLHLGDTALRYQRVYTRDTYNDIMYLGNTFTGMPFLRKHTTTPEGNITGPVGSICVNTSGGAGTTLYVKESGTGSSGWVAK
jgi:hypothetical protein